MFEWNLFIKLFYLSGKGEVEFLIFDDYIVVYKVSYDLCFYVVVCYDENELILVLVFEILYEVFCIFLRGVVDKYVVLENFDFVLLVIDELIDGGFILEIDLIIIVNCVLMEESMEYFFIE